MKGLVLYHNCREFLEILGLRKVEKKYQDWQKLAVSDTDIISSRKVVSSSGSDVASSSSTLPPSHITTTNQYKTYLRDYLLACGDGKEARITIMYGAGDKDCLKAVYEVLQDIYSSNPNYNLKLLKLEVVTCRYSQDEIKKTHDPELGATIYQAQEEKSAKSRGKKNAQNDLIKLCDEHDIAFCLKYPVCYLNPGVFKTMDGLVTTDEIAYFKNYSEVEIDHDEYDRFVMKVKDEHHDHEKEIIEASKKQPGTKIGVYNAAYFKLCSEEKRSSIIQRSNSK